MPPKRAVFKRVVRHRIHFVTLSGVVYVTVVKRSVTGALKCHTIYTTHLRMKGRVKNLDWYYKKSIDTNKENFDLG